MSGFVSPNLLWLAAACLVLWWLFARVQRRALDWIGDNVSKRFRRRLTAYGPASYRLHLALLLMMALALVVGAAGPYDRGETETVMATGRLLFLVDASASMWASDVSWLPPPVEGDAPDAASDDQEIRRMDVARGLARSLMRELRGFRFALGSFSGTAVVHLPMGVDLELIDSALETFEVHSYYRNTGSSLARALDLVPHFVDRRGFRLQVVLLSDGEQPVEDDLGAQLASLAEQGVPVHTVAIGSTQGQGRRIFDFRDVVDKKEERRVLAEFHTRRVDRHLKTISRETGGSFFVAEDGVVGRLTSQILNAGLEVEPFEHQAARADRSGRFLLLFLIGLIFDALLFGRRPVDAPVRFELDRLGPRSRSGAAAATLVSVLIVGCSLPFGAAERGSPRQLAHRENERGIVKDGLREYSDARVHFERSMGYEVEPQIPAYNLARTVLMTGDFSEAHELFQDALLIDPDLPEAHYNDGMTLFLWGEAERDPNDCELERTRELWGQALRRFSSARAAGVGQQIGDQARANRAALADEIAEVDRLIAEPPPACRGESEDSSDPSGSGGEGESGEGGSSGGEGGGEGGEGQAGGGAGQEGEGQAGGGAGEEGEGGQGGQGEGEGEDEGEGEGEGQEGEGGQGENQEGEGDPENEGDEPEGGGGAGAGQPPPGGGDDPNRGGGSELTESELDEIRQQLQLLAAQRREPGKYHRRTLPEQFRKSDWSNPEPTIWW